MKCEDDYDGSDGDSWIVCLTLCPPRSALRLTECVQVEDQSLDMSVFCKEKIKELEAHRHGISCSTGMIFSSLQRLAKRKISP